MNPAEMNELVHSRVIICWLIVLVIWIINAPFSGVVANNCLDKFNSEPAEVWEDRGG